jgi:hypothetical protein
MNVWLSGTPASSSRQVPCSSSNGSSMDEYHCKKRSTCWHQKYQLQPHTSAKLCYSLLSCDERMCFQAAECAVNCNS